MVNIKTKEQIKKMKEAGKIAYETLQLIEKNIKPGITTEELNTIAHNFIIKNKATPSFLNYGGYPKSICTSINEVVVHGIPNNSDKLKNGDIISVDVGVYKNGVHADTAKTYQVGKVNEKTKDLLKNTQKALYEGIKIIKPGIKLNEVCTAIESVAKQNNYGVFTELVGHGVGENLHEQPNVPNYENNESDLVLKEGMTLAIEPMFSQKGKEIYMLEDEWTIVTADNSNAAHFEHTIVVTKDGYEILTGE